MAWRSVGALVIAIPAGGAAGCGLGAGACDGGSFGGGALAGCCLRHAAPKTTNPTTRRRGVESVVRRRTSMRSGFESIPGFPHRQNVARLRRIILQLSTQLRDMNVDGARHDLAARTPIRAKQLDAGRAR